MTKRESLKKTNEGIESVGKKGFISFGLSLLSLIFALPIGETLLSIKISIQLWASIISTLCLLYFLYWVYLEIKKRYLEKTMKYELYVNGHTPLFNEYADIKIENKEPVNLVDVHVKLCRFSYTKTLWNSVLNLTGNASNNFFSDGLPEKISEKPVFIKIGQKGVIENTADFLLDKYPARMPLWVKDNEYAFSEYELVFEISGRFEDKNERENFGIYYGKLIHKKIGEQHVFNWEKFYKTSKDKELLMKMERERDLGIEIMP